MKRQEITPEINKAIWDWYRKEKITQSEIAELVGMSNQGVNKWFTGEVTSIRRRNWELLLPHISKFLSDTKVSGNLTVQNSVIVEKNKGDISQVSGSSSVQSLIDQVINDPELSADSKVEIIKILNKETVKNIPK